jgi:hypothetical protein
LIVELKPSSGHLGCDSASKICGMAILVIMTLRHTFRPGPVSVHRVMGGVAAYLLIGEAPEFAARATTRTDNMPTARVIDIV